MDSRLDVAGWVGPWCKIWGVEANAGDLLLGLPHETVSKV